VVEIKFWGRYGQPVGKIARAIGKSLMAEGRHVQVFDGFGTFRPGNPMNSIVRVSDEVIRERSANETAPDVVVVLDNSLFEVTDVTKGLKPKGVVMALGVEPEVLGEKTEQFKFIKLDAFIKREGDPAQELL